MKRTLSILGAVLFSCGCSGSPTAPASTPRHAPGHAPATVPASVPRRTPTTPLPTHASRHAPTYALTYAPTSTPTYTPAYTSVRDSLDLTHMAPEDGTVLLRGQTVTFTGTVAYSLGSAQSGRIVLTISDLANHPLQRVNEEPSANVGQGSGHVTLSQSVTLPSSGAGVRVDFALVPSQPAVAISAREVSVAYSLQ